MFSSYVFWLCPCTCSPSACFVTLFLPCVLCLAAFVCACFYVRACAYVSLFSKFESGCVWFLSVLSLSKSTCTQLFPLSINSTCFLFFCLKTSFFDGVRISEHPERVFLYSLLSFLSLYRHFPPHPHTHSHPQRQRVALCGCAVFPSHSLYLLMYTHIPVPVPISLHLFLEHLLFYTSLVLSLFFLLDAEWKGPERGHVRGTTALL